ncbi:hypothetical protein ACG2LH_08330 [Zhouia sp. PK063]|uniref:hypothetical protein n=1 Tax=Zhouia sp. PK063 TaxID=3373602 RepID=UPI0037AC8ACA
MTNWLEMIFESIVIISGLGLFFVFLKPFKKINWYFSVYAIWTVLIPTGFLIGGIFWGVTLSILLHPFWPDRLESKQGEISVYKDAKGFMSPCCQYKVTEQKLWILEKNIGEFYTEGQIDPDSIRIKNSTNLVEVKYSTDLIKEIEKIEIKKYGS